MQPPLHPTHPPHAGFVLVKKVPGTLHFVARAPGHSFDYLNMNLSHQVCTIAVTLLSLVALGSRRQSTTGQVLAPAPIPTQRPPYQYLHPTLPQVHYLYFGNKPSPRRRAALAHLHPLGLADDWADKLRGQVFTDESNGITYEHYMQVTTKPTPGVWLAADGCGMAVKTARIPSTSFHFHPPNHPTNQPAGGPDVGRAARAARAAV